MTNPQAPKPLPKPCKCGRYKMRVWAPYQRKHVYVLDYRCKRGQHLKRNQ